MSTDRTRFFSGEPRQRASGIQAGKPPPPPAPAAPRPTLFRRLAVGAAVRLLAGLAVAGFCCLQWHHWWQHWRTARTHRPVNASPAHDWIGYALLAVIGVSFLTFVAWPRRWSARVVWGIAASWTVLTSPLPADPEGELRSGSEGVWVLGILACFFLCLSRPAFLARWRLAGVFAACWIFACIAAISTQPYAALEAFVLAATGLILYQPHSEVRQPGATRANFSRIRRDMSEVEVKSILGPPGDYSTGPPTGPDYPPGVGATHQRIWRTDEGLFWVEFNSVDGRLLVMNKRSWAAETRLARRQPG